MTDPRSHTPISPGRLAGIDYGSRRIGIAISDPGRKFSSPYENYQRRAKELDGERFRRLVAEEAITLFVVGLPLHLSGDESQKSREVRVFGEWLQEITGVEVVYFDERFTSVEAEHLLLSADLTNKRRKERRDMLAAQILLAAYLDTPSPAPHASLDDRPNT